MTIPFFHGTFTIRRTWAATPARVFAAWADPELKAQWFTGPSDRWALIRRSMDLVRGGSEVLEGRFTESGMTTLFEARYHLVEPDQRLVYAYDLHLSGQFHSTTLASLTLAPDDARTHVVYTEQIVFIDGADGTESRRHGTGLQFDAIETVLNLDGAHP